MKSKSSTFFVLKLTFDNWIYEKMSKAQNLTFFFQFSKFNITLLLWYNQLFTTLLFNIFSPVTRQIITQLFSSILLKTSKLSIFKTLQARCTRDSRSLRCTINNYFFIFWNLSCKVSSLIYVVQKCPWSQFSTSKQSSKILHFAQCEWLALWVSVD